MKKNITIFGLILVIIIIIEGFLLSKRNNREELFLSDIVSIEGDVNNDGKVSALDYILVRKHILNTTLLSGDSLKKADVNNDGKVSALDYILIRKIILGIDNSSTTKILSCPVGNISKMYNGNSQTSGITCPEGSTPTGDINATNAGKYILKCVANSGYQFESDCNINWQITQGSTHATITYHKNIPGDDATIVKIYDKSQTLYTFTIPDNWSRDGYVFTGWAETPNATSAPYDVSNDLNTSLFQTGSMVFADLYAVWAPVNSKYGDVLFIGDSYVGTSRWPYQTAQKLGLNGSYNVVYLPGSGFLNTVNGYGELKDTDGKINFTSLLKISDKIIGNNNQVKKVVIAAGYNDHPYTYQSLKQAIISFGSYMHQLYPNAKLYLAMIGTDFVNMDIEITLLNVTVKAYEDAANSMSYAEYIPYTGETTSISDYLRWFADYDGSWAHGCLPSQVNSSCYYWKEGNLGMHASTTSGNIIADVIAKYITTH